MDDGALFIASMRPTFKITFFCLYMVPTEVGLVCETNPKWDRVQVYKLIEWCGLQQMKRAVKAPLLWQL